MNIQDQRKGHPETLGFTSGAVIGETLKLSLLGRQYGDSVCRRKVKEYK